MTFISYAQNFEDLMLWKALKHVEQGFYVDVGANDPVEDSVTYAFYKNGWRGINIEPVSDFYNLLCQERPLDINLQIAAGSEDKELVMYFVPQTGLSTLNPAIAEKVTQTGRDYLQQSVQVSTLNKIFEQYLRSPVHFLKIDVEGYEQEVISGLDLNIWRPWILLIESTKPSSPELNGILWEKKVLESNYHFVYFDGLNRFYVANEHFELDEGFRSPPNIFDDFMISREYDLQEFSKRQAAVIQSQAVELSNNKTDLNDAHTKNYSVTNDLLIAQKKVMKLATELNSANSNITQLNSKLNIANDQVVHLHFELHTKVVELDNIHNSRSVRYTQPFRTITGNISKFRVRINVAGLIFRKKIENRFHQWVVNSRKKTWYIKFKNFFKKYFPNLWHFSRKVLLPSYSGGLYISARTVLLDKLDRNDQYFDDLFLREIETRKQKNNEVKP